jgi:exopolysaccharide production protein ExoQ
MTDAASSASWPAAHQRPAKRRRAFALVLSRDTAIDAVCFVFFLWASTSLRAFLPGVFAGERYAWLLADLLVVGWFLLRPGQVLSFARRNRILIAWGILACLSAAWSLKMVPSLYYGLQLFFTIMMGFWLCHVRSRTRLIQLLFLALLPSQAISVYINYVAPHLAPGFPEGGAFTHKNVLGSFMLLHMFTSLCLLAQGWRPRLTGLGFFGAAALLVLSGSTSSLLIGVMIGGGLIPVAVIYRANVNFAKAWVGAGIVFLAMAAVIILMTGFDPLGALLGSVGKDATLTGRTVLWDFGWQAYLDKPWLGHGFRAYWESETTTVLLLRYVMQQDLEIFHNNFVEVAVAFGFLGPVLLIAGIWIAFRRAFGEFLANRSMSALWAAIFVVFVVTFAFAENPLFNNHGLLQVLFVVAMAARDPVGSPRIIHKGRRN